MNIHSSQFSAFKIHFLVYWVAKDICNAKKKTMFEGHQKIKHPNYTQLSCVGY